MFNGSLELAWHNNLYRAFNMPPSVAEKEVSISASYAGLYDDTSLPQPKRELVPYSAYTGFRAQYEEPQLDEGFAEIKRANWVFEGDEEERRRWSMWLQIDGK